MRSKRIRVYIKQAAIILLLVIGFGLAGIQNIFAAGTLDGGKCGTCDWTIDTAGTLTISAGNLDNWRTGNPPWCSSRFINEIKSVKTDGKVVPATGQNMFIDCINLTEADLSGLDTSRVKSMNSMFSNCKALKELDLSNFDVSGISGARHAVISATIVFLVANDSTIAITAGKSEIQPIVSSSIFPPFINHGSGLNSYVRHYILP